MDEENCGAKRRYSRGSGHGNGSDAIGTGLRFAQANRTCLETWKELVSLLEQETH